MLPLCCLLSNNTRCDGGDFPTLQQIMSPAHQKTGSPSSLFPRHQKDHGMFTGHFPGCGIGQTVCVSAAGLRWYGL